tara:strand:- start:9094 stop:9231 length:138 start_codon:yes stop_codon:yes gene_type:complete
MGTSGTGSGTSWHAKKTEKKGKKPKKKNFLMVFDMLPQQNRALGF